MINPFFLIEKKESNENFEDNEFTASLLTVVFGRYDNESPPFYDNLFNDNHKKII